jgi:hypothetical protein
MALDNGWSLSQNRDGTWAVHNPSGSIVAIARNLRAARIVAELRGDRSLSRQTRYEGSVR